MKKIDEQISNLIALRSKLKENDEAVRRLKNKFVNRGVLYKPAEFLSNVLNGITL